MKGTVTSGGIISWDIIKDELFSYLDIFKINLKKRRKMWQKNYINSITYNFNFM